MSITINTLPQLYPAYSNNLILNAVDSAADTGYTYHFEIEVNEVLVDTIRLPADPLDYSATLDLSPVVSSYVESSVYVPTGTTVSEKIDNGITSYRVNIKSYDEDNVQSASLYDDTRWVFNGCTNINEGFDLNDYLMDDPTTGSTGYFLTNWHGNRHIDIEDICYLQTISGDYGSGYTSTFNGVIIKTYKDNVLQTTVSQNYTDYSKGIVNIDVSPSKLNTVFSNPITSDIDYYTVNAIGDRNREEMRINLINDTKHSNTFNFIYVNRLGGIDCFTATHTNTQEYDIDKKLQEQFVRQRPYYTDVMETETVLTQFLSVEDLHGIKELFMSPAVMVWANGQLYYDVRITNKRVNTQYRYPKQALQLEIEFQYNNKYFTQQY